jgi:hypothetical protein
LFFVDSALAASSGSALSAATESWKTPITTSMKFRAFRLKKPPAATMLLSPAE